MGDRRCPHCGRADRFATPAEIAEELGISEASLLEIRNSGREFPWVRLTRQRWGVPWAAFDAWLSQEAIRNAAGQEAGAA